MKKILKDPLIHFLALGALIFAAYAWVNEGAQGEGEIVVTRGQQAHLINVFTRTWQRPPTADEFDGLVQDYIREEIAYREGQAMGLAENDTVIRRRVRQKLELLTDEMVSLEEPDDATLEAFLRENIDDFMSEPRLDLRHIYFSRDRRGESARGDALEVLELLKGEPAPDWTALGDPLPIGDYLDNVRRSDLQRQFGSNFGARVFELERGVWTGPVESGFGLHLVYTEDFVPAGTPGLEAVRRQVRAEWFARQRAEATDRLYERLADNYEITVEPLEGAGAP